MIIIGCSKETPYEIVELPDNLLPLSDGNSWVYTFQRIKLNGILDTLIDTSQYLVSGKAFGDYFAIEYSTSFQTIATMYYYKNNDVGLWAYNTTSGLEELYLKYPSDTGDSHSWRGFTVKTISNDTVLIVDSSTYLCYHYYLSTGDSLANNTTQHIDYFYAPNIGMIKQISRTFAHNDILQGTLQTLFTYNVN
ncbi:MAG: hypothetical protein DWP97_07330 [Calditrichaeota bacterium]|nr:MAG: hypothetical protein DWP97_07330 [Calditrichota bacterium]